MQSLREKLLKAGLISEDRLETQAEEARSKNGRAPRGRPAEGSTRRNPPMPRARSEHEQSARSTRPIPKLPPLAVPNNKELQRLEARKQLELERRIRELVVSTQLELQPGEQAFYFVTRKNRLRRMELTPDLARKLEAGEVAVVERPEPDRIEHSIVPASTADRILELSSRAVRFYNRKESPVGFLSDEELARRQRAEAHRASEGEEESETQHLAANAERDAARSSTAED